MENEVKNEGKNEAKPERRKRMYDTLAMITMEDNGKTIHITTINNSSIMGKLNRVSPYELEIIVKGRDQKEQKIIVMKHFIAYLGFILGGIHG